MAKYFADIEDIEFNLFSFLEVQNHKKYSMEVQDIKDILSEYVKFIENEIFPSREPSDLEGVRLENGTVYVPKSIHKFHKSYYENGWFALGLPEPIGGVPVSEALNMACLSLGTSANVAYTMYPGLSKAALNVINLKGSEELRELYIAGMMDGRWGGTMCLTEAGAGSDVGALRTTAIPNGDGSFNIEGVKIFISGGDADIYENQIHLVLAKTPGAPDGTKGISLFLVPKVLVNDDKTLGATNNVICTKIEHKMGIHASATCELTFGGEGECKGWLIGKEFEGMQNMFIMMNEARLTCSMQGEAQASSAFLNSLHYAKERVQFGTEIANHGDVKRMLLKMRAVSRGLRALTYYTADLFDASKNKEEAEGLINFLTPICKAYCTEEGFLVSAEAVQVHGGYGYCQEYGVEQYVRDSIIGKIYEGTNGIQALDLVTRKILKDQGKSLGIVTKKIMTFLGKLDDNLSTEKEMIVSSLKTYDQVMKKIQRVAQEKKFNEINEYAFDVLMMTSHIVVTWLLGEQSLKVNEKEEGFSQEFKQSKVDDFKVFTHYYLSKNEGLSKAILSDAIELSSLVL